MLLPKSETDTATWNSPGAALTLMVDDSGECLAALVSRLPSTWNDARSVRHDPGQVRRDVDTDGVPVPADTEGSPCLFRQDRYVRRLRGDRQGARLYAGNVKQVR